MDSAFKPVSIINNEVGCEVELANLIYQQKNPCYERGPVFDAQCTLLIEKLKNLCDELGIRLNDNTEILSRFCLRLQTDYYANQSSLFYASLKKYLEHIYLGLQKNIALDDKKVILNELLPNLLMCGPGVFTHLTEMLGKLTSTFKLTRLLAEMRRNIIVELAAKHCQRKNMISANWIHADNVFLAYAEKYGLAPLGGEEHDYLIEVHYENAQVQQNDLENFLVDFHLQYEPHTILATLGNKLEPYYLTLLAQLNQLLTPEKTILLNSQKDYTRLRDIIEHQDGIFIVSDLFTADDDNTSLLRLRTPYAALVSMCLRSELFTQSALGKKNDNIRYIPADPPILMIDDVAGESAIEYFHQRKLWPLLSLDDIIKLHIPLTLDCIKYYISRGHSNFKQCNFSRLIANYISLKDQKRITFFQQIGANLSLPLEDGTLPIELATQLSHWDIVRYLIGITSSRKPDRERYGALLILAARANQTDIVLSLLQANAAINYYMPSCGNSTLHFAVEHRNKAIIACLVAGNADITIMNNKKLTPIELAAENGAWEIVNLIAGIRATDAEDKAHYGSALLSAARANELQTVKVLIFAGASINWQYTNSQVTAIHCAVEKRNIEMIKLLINANADLTQLNNDKLTPICYAATLQFWDVVVTIAEMVPQTKLDYLQYTETLLLAAEANEIHAVKALIASGADCNGLLSADGNSALHWAIKHRNKALITVLLNAKADLKLMNDDDLTPIEYAKKLGAFDMVVHINNHGSITSSIFNFFQGTKTNEEPISANKSGPKFL